MWVTVTSKSHDPDINVEDAPLTHPTDCPCTVTYTTPANPDKTVSSDYITITNDGQVVTITNPPTNPPGVPISTLVNTKPAGVPVEPTATATAVIAGAASNPTAGFAALAIAGVAALMM